MKYLIVKNPDDGTYQEIKGEFYCDPVTGHYLRLTNLDKDKVEGRYKDTEVYEAVRILERVK